MRLSDDELTEWAERAGVMQATMDDSVLRSIVDELRSHRAAALSAEDVESLRHALLFVAADLCGEGHDCQSSACQRNLRAIGVLQRLIAAHGGAK